jgi:hypothetical protein
VTQKLEHVAPTELRPGFCDETINIALLTELNGKELPAGIADPGYNAVLNQRKRAQITRDVATRGTNFVLFVVFCSAL